MGFSLLPTARCDSVLELTPEVLRSMGVTLVLADLDNTLVKYGQRMPEPEVLAWRDSLRKSGIILFLLSNSRKPRRARDLAKVLECPYLGHAGKPGTKGFHTVLKRTGRGAKEAAMVGDQIFTDVLGANRAGIRSILVQPIELKGNPGRYLRYAVEGPFRYLARRRSL